MKILILASNPRNDLDLNQEIRDLKDVIDSSRNRQEFEVEDALAVRVGDLQELLFKHQPQIVHFCGHGGGQPGLVFEGSNGEERWVRTEALRDLFRLFSSNVGCVLLNACYSEEQANEIVNHIDYVIGMNQAIRDDAAIAFAKGFYRALGYDCSIEEAYEFGCNAIQLEIAGDSTTRSAATDSARKAELVNTTASTIVPELPEHLKPVLKKSKNASSSSRWREGSTKPPPLPQEKREALQQEVVRAVTGFGANNRSASTTPNPIVIPEPPQVLPEAPKAPSKPLRHIRPFILGGLVACLISAIGIYGYPWWPKPQPPNNISPGTHDNISDPISNEKDKEKLQLAGKFILDQNWEAVISVLNQIPANSTVATQNEYQAYLDNASEQTLRVAKEFYEKGDIDNAINKAKVIPQRSPRYYQQAQATITAWTEEKQILVDIKEVLKKWDLKGARERLEKIKNPGLKNQAQEEIRKIDAKYEKSQQNTFDTLMNGLDTQWDVVGARSLLEKITKPVLREQAEAHIKEIEEKIQVAKLKKTDSLPKPNPIPTEIPQAKTEQKMKL